MFLDCWIYLVDEWFFFYQLFVNKRPLRPELQDILLFRLVKGLPSAGTDRTACEAIGSLYHMTPSIWPARQRLQGRDRRGAQTLY